MAPLSQRAPPRQELDFNEALLTCEQLHFSPTHSPNSAAPAAQTVFALALDSWPLPSSSEAVECFRCGRQNPVHASHCLDCGNVLQPSPAPAPLLCSRCQADNPLSARFCRECGNALQDALQALDAPQAELRSATPAPQLASPARRARSDSRPHLPRGTSPSSPAPPGPSARIGSPAPRVLARITPGPSSPAAHAAQLAPEPVLLAPAPEWLDAAQQAATPHITADQAAPSTEPARLCEACGATNTSVARFCQICGIPLPSSSGSGARPRSQPPALPTAEARLVVIAQDGSAGTSYPLSKTESLLGSSEEAQIQLKKDPFVSPLHARLSFRDGQFYIEDTQSLNGVFVRIRSPRPLLHRDVLLLGLEVLRFELMDPSEQVVEPAFRNGTRVFGCPKTPRYARLTMMTVEEKPRDVYYLSRAETILGREQGDIVFTEDPFMSRRHAAIRRDPNTNHFTLRDLGSSNGTFVAIRKSHPLSHGDFVRIGQHLFRLDVRRGG